MLKDKIENNLTLYTLGLLLSGFLAGIGVYKSALEIAGPKAPDTSPSSWSPVARAADWLPKGECPAYPVSLALSSPGSGASVGVSGETIYSDVVIQASRPIPDANAVGLIVNHEGDNNYYVVRDFGLKADSIKKIFKSEKFIFLPYKPKSDGKLNIWAFTVDDENKLGTVYGGLDQVKDAASEMTISQKVVVLLRPE
jgi:hypothetical protein